MVVFLDLDEDELAENIYADHRGPAGFAFSCLPGPITSVARVEGGPGVSAGNERPNPNLNVLSEALGCYPVIIQIAALIDQNTLHALSRTCRQIRANLLQYRHRLVEQTLRCSNERQDTIALQQSSHMRQPDIQRWHILGEAGHIVSGKVSSCARDLVSDCRRCGRIVCRNCTIKPPPSPRIPSRLRRLCPICISLPLTSLTTEPTRQPCTCAGAVHLCVPCGAKLAEADTTYRRVWTWRTRYTTYLGGLGTGIGEGNEGVKCARGANCAGGKEVEVEFECPTGSSSSGSESGEDKDRDSPFRENDEAGYWRQEIEGLGGVVKKKFRKREKVGGTVREWEEERDGGELLRREKFGIDRAWCGWCGRVVLAEGEDKGNN
ncbi:MAG: hypothetical protein Q9163_004521 [Psora crenata]